MKYQPVIGLEVHVELKTKSKMFCGCSADYFGKSPNTHTCPVCLGLPGALPVPNKTAIEWCVLIGIALNCDIPLFAKFDRKNYFYPDLPKGYQISQYDEPFARNGYTDIKSEIRNSKSETNSKLETQNTKRIRIRRVHMEEDTAKLTHQGGASLIDFNRSGVPLVEIVTEPDFETAQEVVAYLKKLQQIVRYLGVSNADMEKGDMRLEPNISLRPTTNNQQPTTNLPKYKVEVKNINSFRFVEKAIHYEIARQTEILKRGETPLQETRGWDENKQKTLPQRTKEEAHDYRYFPEPDIPPIHWTKLEIQKLKDQTPELPNNKFERFQKEYNLSSYDAEIITKDRETADCFEETVRIGRDHNVSPKQIANVIINKKPNIAELLPAMLIKQIKEESQVATIDENELERIISSVLAEDQKAVEDYKKGKETVIMFLVGQVMRKVGKKIDAQMVKEKIQKNIKE